MKRSKKQSTGRTNEIRLPGGTLRNLGIVISVIKMYKR